MLATLREPAYVPVCGWAQVSQSYSTVAWHSCFFFPCILSPCTRLGHSLLRREEERTFSLCTEGLVSVWMRGAGGEDLAAAGCLRILRSSRVVPTTVMVMQEACHVRNVMECISRSGEDSLESFDATPDISALFPFWPYDNNLEARGGQLFQPSPRKQAVPQRGEDDKKG